MTIPRLPVVKASRFFAGGRAPICWQQQMKRPSTTPKTLERACGWLPELTGKPAPKLRTRPLLGDCLAELVMPLPPTEEPAPASAPKRPRANEQRPSADQPTPRRKLNSYPVQQKAGPKPGTQPAQATLALLSRLAGTSGSPRQQRLSNKPPFQPPASRTGQPALLPAPGNHAWPEHVANGVRRRLWSRTPNHAVASGLERLPAPEYGLPQNLAAQWQQPLSGQTVSAAHLAAWVNRDNRRKQDQPGNIQAEGTATGNGRTTTDGKSTRLREPGVAARPTAGHSFYRRRGGSITSGRRQNGGTPVTEPGDEDWTGETAVYPTHQFDDEMGVDTTSRFAPPQMAATLPALRPPPWPGAARDGMRGTAVTPSPGPLATLVARESARREATTAPEDLDDLARKLTQILEEESRRHGIDV